MKCIGLATAFILWITMLIATAMLMSGGGSRDWIRWISLLGIILWYFAGYVMRCDDGYDLDDE